MTSHPPSDASGPVRADSAPVRIFRPLRAWWREPRITRWLLAALAALLFLHKPSALLTPQLWAEDGSIFLTQQQLFGLHALFIPYMGYLHFIPRLIAWTAAHLLDPVSWPAFYNGAAFVIWIAVIARLFSRRLDLPGKPWLALAMCLAALTPEVLFNITNLQWLTAFVLLQQAFIARPINWWQRATDWLLLGLVALTGPFAILFLPLFLWRWWRDRHPDALAALFLTAAGAGVQAGFIATSNPFSAFPSGALRPGNALEVLISRLLVEPLLGVNVARQVSPMVTIVVGGVILIALFVWVLRPHPRRALRAGVLLALAITVLAAFLRTRFDTWPPGSFSNADRYFYIPRVLLAWLVIWEFSATPRFVAWMARGAAVLAAIVSFAHYRLPAPPNYHWADHCAPIRLGQPAAIPTLPPGWILHYPGRLAVQKEQIPTRPPEFLTHPRLLCSTRGGFVFHLQATQHPFVYTATGLPPGLDINGASGSIAGRPEHAGTFNAVITATNALGSATREFTFQVEDQPYFGRVIAPASCTAGVPAELRFQAFDVDKTLDFVDITDLTTGKVLKRVVAGAGERQLWSGRYALVLNRPGGHRISLRFVRYHAGIKQPYTFFDRTFEIQVGPAKPK